MVPCETELSNYDDPATAILKTTMIYSDDTVNLHCVKNDERSQLLKEYVSTLIKSSQWKDYSDESGSRRLRFSLS